MSTTPRQLAINSISSSPSLKADWLHTTALTEVFGCKVFNDTVQRRRLKPKTYRSLRRTIDRGEILGPDVANDVADAMKDWAVEHGATHFTHWFQPMTGLTAEKHDSFLSPSPDGRALMEFSGKELIKGEPDASSFPSGGSRATFEARGYTAWDPSSPAFLRETKFGATLYIPTAFCSWTGESLDTKTPLLRSCAALGKQARRLLELIDEKVEHITATVGPEQEYFLIDRALYKLRPDLRSGGRTLFGAKPPKGQELEDHYFAATPERVLNFMMDLEHELWQLGVPLKTRHNEVAPHQFELAPMYENVSTAVDHNMLTMEVLETIAGRHGFKCLLHEKAFSGVNGSGKHNNWSMATDTGMNLLEPGDNPHDNIQFLFFCAAVIRAVHRHQDLLRISVASAANDHRLGANEAPPAIISIFLGEQLEDVFNQLEHGPAKTSKQGGLLGLGVDSLPHLPRHAGDRNRTSPFAFTGNKFEFRAVGSSQSVSFPNIVLNVIVAEALVEMGDMLEAELAEKKKGKGVFDVAVAEVIKRVIHSSKAVLFGGDNYSDEWHQEAERRGLLNLRTTMDAYHHLLDEKNIKLFERAEVLSEVELRAREEILTEQYFIRSNIEAETTEYLGRTYILPAAVRYLTQLNASGGGAGVKSVAKDVSSGIDALCKSLDALRKQNRELGGDTVHEKAEHMRKNVIGAMNQVRADADALEGMVAHDMWPLPTYREILWVK